MISIIIPTRNRAAYLRDTVNSIFECYCDVDAELIIIDNGSTDTTSSIIEELKSYSPIPMRNIYEPCPGLHVGRNLGAQIAKGDILAYLDDDIVMQKGWFEAVVDNFSKNQDIALLGGPCLPLWEGEKPKWLSEFYCKVDDGWSIPVLSLIDLGKKIHNISGNFVFGCNFCIRKNVVFDAGGFHPDGMPNNLLKFRGDGETGMGAFVESIHKQIIYDPRVKIFHRVPKDRLTKNYIKNIFIRNAYSNVYAEIRKSELSTKRNINVILNKIYSILKLFFNLCAIIMRCDDTYLCKISIFQTFIEIKHYFYVITSKDMIAWCKQKKYFKEDPCPYFRG